MSTTDTNTYVVNVALRDGVGGARFSYTGPRPKVGDVISVREFLRHGHVGQRHELDVVVTRLDRNTIHAREHGTHLAV